MSSTRTNQISGPNYSDASRDAVLFQDLEGSQIYALRQNIRKFPYRHTIIYLLTGLVWVLILTASTGTENPSELALAYIPHVGLFMIVLGTLIYPTKLILVPTLAFTAIFLLQAIVPSLSLSAVINGVYAPALYLMALIGNLSIGLITGGVGRIFLNRYATTTDAHTLDLVVSTITGMLFTVVAVAVVLIFYTLATNYFPQSSIALGINDIFLHTALIRCAYGGIVASIFLLGVLQFPRPLDLVWAMPFTLLYAVLNTLQELGFGVHEMLDPIALSAVLTVALPVRLVVPTLMSGILVYIMLSGTFVSVGPFETELDQIIETYCIIGLAVIVAILAMRSHLLHNENRQTNSIRRLNTVRNYAGVGIFSVDIRNRLVSVDPVTQRMLGVPSQFDVAAMMRKFGPREQKELRRLMFYRPGETTTLLARLREVPKSNNSRVIRLFLWYERSVENSPVVYGLVVDVTGEHLQERALKETLAELSIRQDQQKQMFSIISHELRTPASVISMLIDDLNDENANVGHTHHRLREATDQLLGVLTDMRQAVNPEKNLPVNIQPFRPTDVAESIRNTFEMQAQSAKVQIQLRLGDGAEETVLGDNVRIKQVLGNLIKNAIIHSRCSTITLSYRAGLDGADGQRMGMWAVTDDGIGIPDDEVERLFQPFQRGGSDARNRPDGSGLGLYIVRTSIQLLGGDVRYFPAPEGGAGYHVRLPEPLASQQQIQAHKQTHVADVDFSALYVVLAEDNPLVAEVTSARLRKLMGRVEVAPSGRAALDLIEKDPPDLVITDLFMPEMSGDELTQTLRSQGFERPIVGLTAAVVGDDMRRFELAGASTVMSKPLDTNALMKFLESHQPNSENKPEPEDHRAAQ